MIDAALSMCLGTLAIAFFLMVIVANIVQALKASLGDDDYGA